MFPTSFKQHLKSADVCNTKFSVTALVVEATVMLGVEKMLKFSL